MVKDLENQLELKTSEIDRLNEQLSSLLRDKHKCPDNKVYTYAHPYLHDTEV